MRYAMFAMASCVLAATSVAAQGIPPLTNERYTLDNGLTVILHEDRSTPMVAVNVWYHVGSGDEQPGRTGFAHLFEHVMFMGSEHVPGVLSISGGAGSEQHGSTTRTARTISSGCHPTRCRLRSGSRRIAWAGSCPPWIRRSSMCSAMW